MQCSQRGSSTSYAITAASAARHRRRVGAAFAFFATSSNCSAYTLRRTGNWVTITAISVICGWVGGWAWDALARLPLCRDAPRDTSAPAPAATPLAHLVPVRLHLPLLVHNRHPNHALGVLGDLQGGRAGQARWRGMSSRAGGDQRPNAEPPQARVRPAGQVLRAPTPPTLGPHATHLEHVDLLQRHLALPGAVETGGVASAPRPALHLGHTHALQAGRWEGG